MVHGRNFRLNMAGKWEKFGFYTPRFTEAPDPALAEHVGRRFSSERRVSIFAGAVAELRRRSTRTLRRGHRGGTATSGVWKWACRSDTLSGARCL